MKKIIIVMGIVLGAVASFAATPTTVVKKAFDQKFPTATKITWGMENSKEWEAEFVVNGEKISANFSLDGTWLETEQEIKATALPKGVSDAIKLKYAGWIITEADKTETSKHGTIYEADLKKGSAKKAAAFKEDGTPVKE